MICGHARLKGSVLSNPQYILKFSGSGEIAKVIFPLFFGFRSWGVLAEDLTIKVLYGFHLGG